MNRRKLAWLLSGALLLVILLGIVCSPRPAEPSYHGKTLSEWLAIAYLDSREGLIPPGPDEIQKIKEAREAISAMACNALPYFMEWIQYRTPAWHSVSYEIFHGIPFGISRLGSFNDWAAEYRADSASIEFHLLGTNASPALPQLCAWAQDVTDVSARHERAFNSLQGFGRIATPSLLSMITNCTLPMELRSRAAAMVGQSDRPEDRSPEVIPELLKLLDSGDSNLFGGAISGLINLGAKPETIVPLLIATLQSANENPSLSIHAAAGLGKYGTNAMAAVPALMDLLQPDKTQDQRVAAEAALLRIQPKALPNLDTSSL